VRPRVIHAQPVMAEHEAEACHGRGRWPNALVRLDHVVDEGSVGG